MIKLFYRSQFGQKAIGVTSRVVNMSAPALMKFHHETPVEDWTSVKLVEHYHANSRYRVLGRIMDRIKMDLQEVADPNSTFEVNTKKKGSRNT